MSFETYGLKNRQVNVGLGYTKFFDAPQQVIEVYQMVVTASADATIQFGGPGAPATPEWTLAKGVPMVLPQTTRGWWAFDPAEEVGVNVQSGDPGVSVAILALFRKE